MAREASLCYEYGRQLQVGPSRRQRANCLVISTLHVSSNSRVVISRESYSVPMRIQTHRLAEIYLAPALTAPPRLKRVAQVSARGRANSRQKKKKRIKHLLDESCPANCGSAIIAQTCETQHTAADSTSIKMSVIPKPKMRGLLEANIKRNIISASIFSLATGLLWKIFVTDARKQAYADFYKTYDPEASLKIMNDAGLMQSCPK